jgi:hypothetical protein
MSFTVGGLPLHPLLVHAVVVLLPLAAFAAVLHACWPAARRRLGVVTPILAGVALILVPITVQAGEALRASIGESPKVARHAAIADSVLPWAVALFAVALAEWLWFRFGKPQGAGASESRRRDLIVRALMLAAAVAVAAGSLVVVFRTGDSGARAVWEGVGK